MRWTLLLIISTYGLSAKAQSIDESKYLYLLDLEIDTLCVDCQISNCAAIFYNAHSFKQLRHLTLKNLDYDLNYIQYFRNLRSLKIENTLHPREKPRPNKTKMVLYDITNLLKNISKCKRLRSLSIDGAKFNHNRSKRVLRQRYFHKFNKLKVIKLTNIETDDGVKLIKDIRKHCARLDSLVITNSGVNLFNYPRRRKRFFFPYQEGYGNDLDYLEIDGLLTAEYLTRQLTRLNNQRQNLYPLANRSKYLRKLRPYRPKVKHLVLAKNKDSYKVNRSRDNGFIDWSEIGLRNLQYSYVNFLLNDWMWSYKVDKLTAPAFPNYVYDSTFNFYATKVYLANKSILDTAANRSQSVNQNYIGNLSTGTDNYIKWLSYLEEYDRLKNRPISWDTTDIGRRKEHTTYGNYYQMPLLWGRDRRIPSYFRKSKMKKIAKDYQSLVSVSKSLRKKGETYYSLSYNKKSNGNMLPDLEYKRSKDGGIYSRFRRYTFTSKSKYKLNKLKDANILDLWPVYDEQDSVYFLVYKTTRQVDSIKIQWWDTRGDTIRTDFQKFLSNFQKYEERKVRIVTRRSQRSKMMYYRRNDKLKPITSQDYVRDYLHTCGDSTALLIDPEKWERMYQNYIKDRWSFLKKGRCSPHKVEDVLRKAGFCQLDETGWYKQFANIELVTLRTSDERMKLTDTDILLIDRDKKTYTKISHLDDGYDLAYKIILPSQQNSAVSIVTVNSRHAFYTVSPSDRFDDTVVPQIILEYLPLQLIDNESLLEIVTQ